MGVSVQEWRARTGLFDAGRQTGSKGRKGKASTFQDQHSLISAFGRFSLVLKLLPFLCLLSLLLASGIEPHPGPPRLSYKDFICVFCKNSFSKLRHYVLHQQVHSSNKNFSFPCVVKGCSQKFSSLSAFQVHYGRHQKPDSSKELDLPTPSVCFCQVQTCSLPLKSKSEFLKHSALHLKQFTPIKCLWCDKPAFTNVNTFRVHVSVYHRDSDLPSNPINREDTENQDLHHNVTLPEETAHEQNFTFDDSDGDDFEEADPPDLYPDYLVKEHIGKFYLMLEGNLLLPSSTVQKISREIAVLSRMSHHCLKKKLLEELKSVGLDSETATKIASNTFRADPVFNVHHKGEDVDNMSTYHMRSRFMAAHFPMVIPKEISFGDDVASGKKLRAHYISIKESLIILLRDPKVKAKIKESFNRPNQCEDMFQDFVDGEAFKEHRNTCKKCIQLILFQDAFEFCAFGPGKGEYKTTGFYYNIGNLPPEYRSKVDMIQCNFLITDKTLRHQKIGYHKALETLLTELKDLKVNGLMLDGEKVPVCVIFMTGDNLGSHQIGGFMEGFTSHYFCRFCDITKAELCDKPYLSKPLRTVKDYDNCAAASERLQVAERSRLRNRLARQRVNQAVLRITHRSRKQIAAPIKRALQKQSKKKKKKQMVTPESRRPAIHVRGVKTSSVLNKIPGFHVCGPLGLPPCLAHDLFEKIVHVLNNLFHHCIEGKKWFTLEVLNRRIRTFKCRGSDKADSPTAAKDSGISGNASETWSLLRLLPFIIGDLILDPADSVWQLYLMLKEITEFVCAPKISKSQIAYLKVLIQEFLNDMKNQFPEDIFPKLHFLLHYPDLILLCGPLIRLWTLRYESKHVFFKSVARVCRTFKNITLTLARKYQEKFAYDHAGQMLPPDIFFPPKSSQNLAVRNLSENLLSIVKSTIKTSEITRVSRVDVKGISYEEGLWLVIETFGTVDLKVGQIEIILYHDEEIYFVLREEIGVKSYQGYYSIRFAKGEPTYSIKTIQNLVDYYPLPAYEVNGIPSVSLKHSVLGM